MGKGRKWHFLLFCTVFLIFQLLSSTFGAENKTVNESNRRGKALNISKKPCSDPSGLNGICTFKWDCIQQNGTKIGTCMDGFIVGTCCYYSTNISVYPQTDTLNEINTNELKPNRYKPYKTNLKTSTTSTTVKPTTINAASSTPQLVTWSSISATKITNLKRPLDVFSPSHYAWPIGGAYSGIQYRPNRPQFYRPAGFGTYYIKNNFNKASNKNEETGIGNFTIFGFSDRIKHTLLETTTIAVPIAQWMSTKTAGNTLMPVASAFNRLPVPTAFPQSVHSATSATISTTVKPSFYSTSWAKNLTQTQNSKLGSTAIVTQPPNKKPLLDYRRDCGVRALAPRARIVGGMSAYFGKWPWQILVKEAAWLGLYHKNKCGGVLISSKYAITAGHCQPGFLSSLVVILGEYDLTMDLEVLKPEMRRVKRMVVHRHYNPQNFDNDIAILELDPPVIFKPHISPICLPHKDEDFTSRMAYVTGWGKTLHGGAIPNLLQEVQVPIVSNAKCLDMFKSAGHIKIIKDNFLCAGYETGGKDSCEGDSGGPLMVQRNDSRWVLAGTVSHGIRCADPNLPGVYMRISSYRSWIDRIINSP